MMSRQSTRQLHVISTETIKPASPTPPHLKCYNLSLLDQLSPPIYIPMVLFFPNCGFDSPQKIADNSRQLKNSLSESLTQYYPFAGRLKAGTYVDCNDEGVEFLEARIECRLLEILDDPDHEALDVLCPAGLVRDHDSYKGSSLVVVQLNYFDCGGMAMAVCMSHKIADACTLSSFLTYWATVTSRSGEEVAPHFIATSTPSPSDDSTALPEVELQKMNNCLTRRFVFPNKKIALLQAMAAEAPGTQTPTRIQALTALLYKCAMSASRANSGSFRPSFLAQPVNMRAEVFPPLPKNSVGNFCLGNTISAMNESEIKLNELADKLTKGLIQIRSQKILEISGWLSAMRESMIEGLKMLYGKNSNLLLYGCTSFCWYPFYDVDFGWGKPVSVTLAGGLAKNTFVLMDTPSQDGIEALVTLEEQDMAIFQHHKELLAYGSLYQSALES